MAERRAQVVDNFVQTPNSIEQSVYLAQPHSCWGLPGIDFALKVHLHVERDRTERNTKHQN